MSLASVIAKFIAVINSLITLMVGIAIVVFFVGIVRYVYDSSDAHGHIKGKELILWGLVALFVLVSVWGILEVACVSFFGSLCGALNESFNL